MVAAAALWPQFSTVLGSVKDAARRCRGGPAAHPWPPLRSALSRAQVGTEGWSLLAEQRDIS